MRACNNLPQPNPYILVFGGCGRLLHALTPPRSVFLYLQFLARCHPYILLHFCTCSYMIRDKERQIMVDNIYYDITFLNISLALSVQTKMPHNLHSLMCNTSHKIELVTHKWRRILRKLPDLTKSPSERYKLSVCTKDHVRSVSKRLCIIFMACSCPNFVLGCLKKKKKKKKKKMKKKKKKMEKITVFPFSVYNSSDVF